MAEFVCGCTARNQHHFFSSFPLSSISSSLLLQLQLQLLLLLVLVCLSIARLSSLISFRLALRSFSLLYFALWTRTFSFMHRISEIHSTFTTQVNKSHKIDYIPATTILLSPSPLLCHCVSLYFCRAQFEVWKLTASHSLYSDWSIFHWVSYTFHYLSVS